MSKSPSFGQDNSPPLMHQRTAMHVKRLLSQRSHAILLSGAEGSGKQYLAEYLAKQLLDDAQVPKSPHYYVIQPNEKGVIPIEEVRRIREITSLKEVGHRATSRVVCLIDVHTMVDAAHHALLKLLEEPPLGTVLIMTTSAPEQLPKTVRSRVSIAGVLPVAKYQLAQQFPSSIKDAERAYYLSGGNVGLYQALLREGDNHPYVQAIAQAKRLIAANTYERLRLIDDLDSTKDPDKAVRTLVALERLYAYSFRQKPTKGLQRRLLAVVESIDSLQKRANRRLVLADLFLKL